MSQSEFPHQHSWRPEFAYSITLSAAHNELILTHGRLRVNYAHASLRPAFAYGITLSALHTELILSYDRSDSKVLIGILEA